jgi:hypothetical protein
MDATPSHRRFAVVALLGVAVLLMVASPANATPTREPRARLVCPPHPPTSLSPHQRARVTIHMVPGHPRRLLGCRYQGSNQPEPQGTLVASMTLPASKIASGFDDARVISPTGPARHCPADFGEQIVLVFGYPDGTSLHVIVEAGGCGDATNGARTVLTPPVLASQLRGALGHDIG